MRRLLLIGLLGCTEVTPNEIDVRLDGDHDGVSAFSDCDDTRPDLQTLLDVVQVREVASSAAGCGTLRATLPSEASAVMPVGGCVDPLDDRHLLALGPALAVHALDLRAVSGASIVVSGAALFRYTADRESVLTAYRGPRCALDACEVSTAVRGAFIPDAPPTEEGRVYLPGGGPEPWYLLVSGPMGVDYDLIVTCE
ncbi:MAG: hypothetical protein KC416_06065 [Myxococcales bacterium]|nr:hypothetical protein [Myxococcales bacterium]MCB9670729.1 hypothetical protein [Alphaproteobacteria bacterium]